MTIYKEDDHLVALMKAGDQQTMKSVYFKMKEMFTSYLMKEYATDRHEALRCYVDAFTTLYLNIRNDKLVPPLRSSLKTYLFSIGKYTYLGLRKKTQKIVALNPNIRETLAAGASNMEKKETAELVRHLLNKLGDPCKSIPTAFFINGYSAESVANHFDLNSESAARKRKFDCLKKIRKLMP